MVKDGAQDAGAMNLPNQRRERLRVVSSAIHLEASATDEKQLVAEGEVELVAERRGWRRALLTKMSSEGSSLSDATELRQSEGWSPARRSLEAFSNAVVGWTTCIFRREAPSAQTTSDETTEKLALEFELARERRQWRRALAERQARRFRADSASVPKCELRSALLDYDQAEQECERLEQALAALRRSTFDEELPKK